VPSVVHVACNCGTALVVLPPALFEAVPDDAELGVLERTAELTDAEGRRYTIADKQGVFRCPACSERRTLPEILSG